MHLPGSNLQSSRLRSSLNARDIPPDDLSLFAEIDVQQQQLLNELSYPSISTNMLSRPARPKTLTPSNLEDIFCAESSSPRYSDQALSSAVFSPQHKSAVLNQFQQQQQTILSPIKTTFSPRNVDHSLMQGPFGLPSPGRMSPRGLEPISPMSARMSMIGQREKQHQQCQSLSSRGLGSTAASAVASLEETWSKWENPNEMPDWAINTDDFGKLKRASSFDLLNNVEEPDLSWVQSLFKESPQDMKEKYASRISGTAGASTSSGEGEKSDFLFDQVDQSVLGAWLERLQLDQMMAK